MDHVEWLHTPDVTDPILLIAFEGWNDAGDAATTAARYISNRWEARDFAIIDPEPFYDFSSNRPIVRLDENHERRLEWPGNVFSHLELESLPSGGWVAVGADARDRPWYTVRDSASTVVEEGSFSRAAEKLERAKSAVRWPTR